MKITVNLNDVYKIVTATKAVSEIQARRVQEIARDVAQQAYGKAIELASDRLRSTKQLYIDALSYDEEGNGIYTITLDARAAHLETGYPSFDMIKAGLARGTKSKISKDGFRYVRIPFQHQEAPGKPGHPENQRKVQIGQPTQTTRGSLAQDLKALKEAFGIRGTMAGPSGQPYQGKVWSITKSQFGPQWTYSDITGKSITKTIEAHHIMGGITGIQYQVKKRGGGFQNRTAYLTWRTASENPKRKPGTWIHPGWKGAKAFQDLEAWVVQTFMRRVQE